MTRIGRIEKANNAADTFVNEIGAVGRDLGELILHEA